MLVGLTGGMGCGKSTVGRLLQQSGFRLLESDQIVRELLSSDTRVIADILEKFGPGVGSMASGINRPSLAALVFKDSASLNWLEERIHPEVRSRWVQEVKREPKGDWCVEIPLLFEKNLENHFQMTVCVEASLSTQLSRLAQRGLSQTQALQRMARQLPLGQKVAKADRVISNNGSLQFLEQQVNLLLSAMAVA